MVNWMDFEDECLDYLQYKYGSKCEFTAMGNADSTNPDIFVTTCRSQFYIEVKKANAQSGQFVLFPDYSKNEFIFSPRNKTEENEFTKMITDYMNDYFTYFNAAGTAGKGLNIDKNIFYNWIVDYYSSKGVKYFMTKGDSYIILPVSNFKNHFSVSAKYRVKRSGSSHPSVKYQRDVISMLENRYNISNHSIEGKKLFVFGDGSVDRIRFIMGDYEYYLAEKEIGKYEVRQLSNTYNMNVIFSISLKAKQDREDLNTFENELV